MSLNVYFDHDIARVLRSVMLARYGNAVPANSEFIEALDAVAAAFGIERVQAMSVAFVCEAE